MQDEINYKYLCVLYNKYKAIIKEIEEAAKDYNKRCDNKFIILNNILREIEYYPVSWKYYNCQTVKFNYDFENLIIFNSY